MDNIELGSILLCSCNYDTKRGTNKVGLKYFVVFGLKTRIAEILSKIKQTNSRVGY